MPILGSIGAAAAKGFGMLGKIAAAVDEYFEYVTLLLPGNGTNGAQNNTFLDSSTNNFTITRNGNTTQGTFSPYGPNWSNYFDGSGDWLQTPANAALAMGTGNFTWECFAYFTQASAWGALFDSRSGNTSDGFYVGFDAGGTSFLVRTSSNIIVSSALPVINSWQHICLVRSGTTLSLYINGVRTGTTTNSTDLSNNVFRIFGAGDPAFGYCSNVRVVKGTAVYDPTQATLTVPTSPLTAITNTSLLTCQSNRFIDNSSNNFTITRNGDVSVQRFSPFASTAPYSAATDGGSGYFGVTDFLSAADNAAFNFGSGNFTLEAFVYITTVSGRIQTIVGKGPDFDNGPSWVMRIEDSTGYLAFTRPGVASYASTLTVPLNQWNHVQISRVGTSFYIGVNGINQTVSGTYVDVTSALRIGFTTTTNSTGLAPPYISSVRILKGTALYTSSTYTVPTGPLTAITNTSLLLNFTNAGIIDNAMMNDLETAGNAQVSTSVSKFGTGSLYFDGTGDWLKASAGRIADFGTGDFTIEAWVYLLAHDGDQSTVFAGGLDFSSYTQPNVNIDTNGTVNLNGNQPTSNALSLNTWTHIAVSRSSGTCRIFINGVQGSSATNTLNYNGIGCYVGVRIGGSVFGDINGYIDDLRITKGVARYTANFTPPAAPFPTN